MDKQNLRDKIISQAKLGKHSALYAGFDVEAASVYRVIQIANSKPYVAISASRKKDEKGQILDPKENNQRNEQLLKDIKEAGLYAYQMIGGYEEDQQDGSKAQVVENSFFVPYDKRTDLTDFINLFIELRDKYNQDTILVGLPQKYDYPEGWEPPMDMSIGNHYYVSKTKADSVGTEAVIQTFDKYGSIAIDPHKNRIIDWVIAGVTTPSSSSGCFLMNRVGLKWFWDGFNKPEIETSNETVKRALAKILAK